MNLQMHCRTVYCSQSIRGEHDSTSLVAADGSESSLDSIESDDVVLFDPDLEVERLQFRVNVWRNCLHDKAVALWDDPKTAALLAHYFGDHPLDSLKRKWYHQTISWMRHLAQAGLDDGELDYVLDSYVKKTRAFLDLVLEERRRQFFNAKLEQYSRVLQEQDQKPILQWLQFLQELGTKEEGKSFQYYFIRARPDLVRRCEHH